MPSLRALSELRSDFARRANLDVAGRCDGEDGIDLWPMREQLALSSWTSPEITHLVHVDAFDPRDGYAALTRVCSPCPPRVRFDAARRNAPWLKDAADALGVEPLVRPGTRPLCILDDALELLDDAWPAGRMLVDLLVQEIVWMRGADACVVAWAHGAVFLGTDLSVTETALGLVRESTHLELAMQGEPDAPLVEDRVAAARVACAA